MALSSSKKVICIVTLNKLRVIFNKSDFYCLKCLHSFIIENKLQSHEKVCKNKDFCGIVIPLQKDKILEFNEYMKSDKMVCIIYPDTEILIRNTEDVQITQKILQQQK